MAAGPKRHRIDIQSPTVTKDGRGQDVTAWATFATVWAEQLTPGAGRERVRSLQVAPETQVLFVIRHRDDVATHHRVLYAGDVYDLRGVGDPEGRGIETVLQASLHATPTAAAAPGGG